RPNHIKPNENSPVSFKIAGPKGTVGFCNTTIPKNDVSYEASPLVFIDNQQAQNQGYNEDDNNFYVWYTTNFSTHQISIQFMISPTSKASLGSMLAIVITIPEIIAVYTIIATKNLRRKPEDI